jgi:hypothetical protein
MVDLAIHRDVITDVAVVHQPTANMQPAMSKDPAALGSNARPDSARQQSFFILRREQGHPPLSPGRLS